MSESIAATAAAFIDPRCFVPKNSAQKTFGSVAEAPDVIPKKTKPNKAEINVSPKANSKKAECHGNPYR